MSILRTCNKPGLHTAHKYPSLYDTVCAQRTKPTSNSKWCKWIGIAYNSQQANKHTYIHVHTICTKQLFIYFKYLSIWCESQAHSTLMLLFLRLLIFENFCDLCNIAKLSTRRKSSFQADHQQLAKDAWQYDIHSPFECDMAWFNTSNVQTSENGKWSIHHIAFE